MSPEGSNSELEALKHKLDVLTVVANQLADRLYSLEDRMARQEGSAARPMPAPNPTPAPTAAPPYVPESSFAEAYVPANIPPPPPPMPARTVAAITPPPETKIETQVGLKWLNRLAVITLILGVAFTFKYVSDNQLVGEGGRVILGVLAAAVALFIGDRMWHRGQRVYAQGLTGLGVAVLYLSFYAAYGLYNLIPQQSAFLLLVLTTTSAGALALRYDSRAIAILALLGGYATPLMLSKHEPNDLFFAAYMAVLNGVVLWVARQRNWRLLEVIAFLGTAFLHGAWIADRGDVMGSTLGVAASLVQYGLFVTSPVGFVASLGQVLFATVIASMHWKPVVQLVLVVAGLGVFRWLRREYGAMAVLIGWWTAYGIGRGVIWKAPAEHAFAFQSVALLLFLAWPVCVAVIFKERPGRFALTAMALSGAAYFGASYDLLNGTSSSGYLGFLAVAVAAAYLAAGWALWNFTPAGERDTRSAILAAGLAMAFVALAVPIQFTGYRIAIAWAIQAAALAFIGSRLPDWRVLIGSAVLALMALMDLPYGVESIIYQPILNASFVTIAVVAISFWAIAYFVSKTPHVPRIWALPPYITGHLVFLGGLHWETFAYLNSIGSSWDSRLLASTLILAVYGMALLAAGVQSRTVVNRVMGLVLFGCVILKLYLSDVWVLGNLFRVVAFLALGGLLLAGSYLYSHYRSRIETLWKKDEKIA